MPIPLTSASTRRSRMLRFLAWGSGGVLLVLWGIFWFLSFFHGFVLFMKWDFGFPAWQMLGLDFFHNYAGATAFMNGLNPYHEFFGDDRGIYSYPPIALLLFSWCNGINFQLATGIWFLLSTAMLAVSLWVTNRHRRERKLAEIPWALSAGLVLWAMPVLFQLERGQFDIPTLLLICLAAVALRRKTLAGDVTAGGMVAFALWTKIYPALLLPGLAALGRFRAAVAGVFIAVIIGGLSFVAVPDWMSTVAHVQQDRVSFIASSLAWLQGKPVEHHQMTIDVAYSNFAHSLSTALPPMLESWGLTSLANIPGLLPTIVICTTWILFVSWKLFRSPRRDELALPFLLWLCQMATVVLPVSYDYNLLFMPLLFLAMADLPRSRWPYFIALAMCLPWLQPFQSFQSIALTVILKTVPIFLMGWVIVRESQPDYDLSAANVEPAG